MNDNTFKTICVTLAAITVWLLIIVAYLQGSKDDLKNIPEYKPKSEVVLAPMGE